jgi:UDP-glucuronate 4-epimerase
MTTFVTGACGFVGLALTEHLLGRGEHVVGFDLAPPRPAAARAFAALPGRLDMAVGDVRDAAAVRTAIQLHRPRRLVTLAAVTANADRERAAPGSIFEVNVGGVIAALAAAADAGVARIVHASSGSVYGASGNGASVLHEDTTPLRPEGLYGISKAAAEAAALRLAALHGLDLVVGRLGTCFGPWEADSGFRDTLSAPLRIVEIAERAGRALLPRPSRRDWLYVRDCAAGLAALLDAPRLPHALYNVAAGFEGSLVDWCAAIGDAHPGFGWRVGVDAQPGESMVDLYAPYDRASMDTTRLRADTGFVPRFDLVAAARDFVDWRRRHGTAQGDARAGAGG